MVQQVLACGQTSARTDLLTRYAKFLKSLRVSTSVEVATMANLVSRDIQSTTGLNLNLVESASGLSAWDTSQEKLREAIIMKEEVIVEEGEQWRIVYLSKLLQQRQELWYAGEDVEEITCLINSLCIVISNSNSWSPLT